METMKVAIPFDSAEVKAGAAVTPSTPEITLASPTCPPTPITDAVELRAFRLDDQPVLYSMGNNPAVYRWLKYGRFPQPYTQEVANAWLHDVAIPSATSDEMPLYLAIAEKATGQCMGCIALEPKKDIEHFTAEIAYWLDEPFWGRRVISQAIGMIVEFGMKRYPHLKRIEAGILSSNSASGRALAGNGFVNEGTMRLAYEKDGKFFDKIMYGYVRDLDTPKPIVGRIDFSETKA